MNKISDTGQKVGGSLKERRQKNIIDDDLQKDMDLYQNILKNKLWPTPSYDVMINNNIPLDVIGLIKTIRDNIAIRPRIVSGITNGMIPEVIEMYSKTLQYMSENIHSVKTLQDLSNMCKHVLSFVGLEKIPENVNQLTNLQKACILSLCSNKYWPFAITEDTYNQAIKVGERLKNRMDEKNNLYKNWSILTFQYSDKKLFALQKNIGKKTLYYGNDNKQRQDVYFNKQELFPTKEEALDAINNIANQKTKEIKISRNNADVQRVGPHYRELINVTPELLRTTFGLKSVEFGEALSNRERQEVINHAYDSFKDLAYILNISDSQIGLEGTLSIAFASRGKANSMAHYEPFNKIINLTRMRGAGSLAHEYGHALDHYLYNKNVLQDIYAQDIIYSSDSPYNKEWDTIVFDMKHKPVNSNTWNKVLLKLHPDTSEEIKMRVKLDSSFFIPLQPGDMSKGIIHKLFTPTDFYKEASKSIKNKYYTSDKEMFARAFESYIYDSLKKENINNHYLVNSVEEDYYIDAKYSFNPYPTNKERDILNKDISQMVQASFLNERHKRNELTMA